MLTKFIDGCRTNAWILALPKFKAFSHSYCLACERSIVRFYKAFSDTLVPYSNLQLQMFLRRTSEPVLKKDGPENESNPGEISSAVQKFPSSFNLVNVFRGVRPLLLT